MGHNLARVVDDLSIIAGRQFEVGDCDQLFCENKTALITKTSRFFFPYCDLLDHYDGEKLTSIPLFLKDHGLLAKESATTLSWCMNKLTALKYHFLGKEMIF